MVTPVLAFFADRAPKMSNTAYEPELRDDTHNQTTPHTTLITYFGTRTSSFDQNDNMSLT